MQVVIDISCCLSLVDTISLVKILLAEAIVKYVNKPIVMTFLNLELSLFVL